MFKKLVNQKLYKQGSYLLTLKQRIKMKTLDKKLAEESKISSNFLYEHEILSHFEPGIILHILDMKYIVTPEKDKIVAKNKNVTLYLGYNGKEYYFTASHEGKMIDYSEYLQRLKKEKYKMVDGNAKKLVLEGKSMKLQFSKGVRDGKEVDVFGYSSLKSRVLEELMKVAEYCREK